MSTDTYGSVKKSFINYVQVRVHVLSYLTSNEGLNLHYNCQNSVMVEQGINYTMEHQAWSHVWRIGQLQLQRPTRLVNLATINQLILYTLQTKQSPMLYTLRSLQNTASEDIDLNTDQLSDTLIGKISPQALQSNVIGQYNNIIMNISEFVIFLYFPFLGLHWFSVWVGSWVCDISFRFTGLFSDWVSRFTPLGFGLLLGYPMFIVLERIDLYRLLVPTNGVI